MGTSLFVFGALGLLIIGCEATLWVLFRRKIPRYCFAKENDELNGVQAIVHRRYRSFFFVHTVMMLICVFFTVLTLWMN